MESANRGTGSRAQETPSQERLARPPGDAPVTTLLAAAFGLMRAAVREEEG